MIFTILLLLGAGIGAAGWMSNRKDGHSVLAAFLIGMPVCAGTVALVLADFGLYRATTLAVLMLLWAVTGLWRLLRAPHRISFDRTWLVSALVLLLAATALFSRPHTYLHGGWDPGEYVSSSAQINRIGSIHYVEPLLPELSDELYAAFGRSITPPRPTLHAGFLVLDKETGEMVPDYSHFYPVWLSLFQFGDSMAFAYRGHTLAAIIALLMVFFFVQRMAGGGVALALLAGVGLLANPAILYYGRFPSSEMLSMALLFGCFYFLTQREEDRDTGGWFWIVFTAFAAATCHIINLLPLTAVTLTVAVYAWMHKDRQGWLDAGALSVGLGLGVLRNAWAAPLYVNHLFSSYVVERPGYIIGSLCALGALVYAVYALWTYVRPRLPDVWRHPLVWRCVPGLLVLAWGLYQYVWRPRWETGANAINLQSLGWLFSPVGLILIGAAFLLVPTKKISRTQALFLAAGVLTTLVLVQSKYVQPFYMWAFRRYTPMVIPFGAILLAYTVMRAADFSRRRVVRTLVIAGFVALVGWQVYQARTLIAIQEHRGLPHYAEQLARELPEADLIVMDHWKLATPLRIGFGLPAYPLSREASAVVEARQIALYDLLIGKLQNAQTVLYLSHTRPFYLPGYHPQAVASYEFRAETLRWERYGIPQARQTDNSDIHVFRFVPGPNRALETIVMDIGYHSAGLIRGFHAIWRHSGRIGRWTNGDAALYIPGLVNGGHLTFSLYHGRPPEMTELLEVRLLLDGEPLATLNIEQDWADYTVAMPASDRATHKLTIQSDTWDPAEFGITGYPTNLGVSITQIGIQGQ